MSSAPALGPDDSWDYRPPLDNELPAPPVAERALACEVLLNAAGLGDLWSDGQPTPRAEALMQTTHRPTAWTHGQWYILRLVRAIWLNLPRESPPTMELLRCPGAVAGLVIGWLFAAHIGASEPWAQARVVRRP